MAFTLTACAALAGCPSAAMFTSPRTLRPGDTQHGIVVETFATPRGESSSGLTGGGVSPVPAVLYTLRRGMTERLELGGRVGLAALGADLKVGLIRSSSFDLAVAPGVHALQGRRGSESYPGVMVSVPLFGGFNLSSRAQVLVGVRAAWGIPFRRSVSETNLALNAGYGGEAILDAIHTAYAGPSVGAGVALRIATGTGVRGVALQPAYDLALGLADDGFIVHSFGVGITFGAQPEFP